MGGCPSELLVPRGDPGVGVGCIGARAAVPVGGLDQEMKEAAAQPFKMRLRPPLHGASIPSSRARAAVQQLTGRGQDRLRPWISKAFTPSTDSSF
jgi:hypothetical protein